MRKFAVIAEAERFGAELVSVDEERADAVEYLFRNGTGRHFYGEVHGDDPPGGLSVHRGEHHGILPCGVPAPAAFLPAHGSWWSSDPTLAWTLDQLEATLGLCHLDWNWYPTRRRREYYPADWGIQLRPLASGAHVAVRGLQGGSFDAATIVGISSFLRMAWAIQTALHQAPHAAPAYEAYPTAFGDRACHRLHDDGPWFDSSTEHQVGSVLESVLSSLQGNEVTLGELSAKRAKLLEEALPASGADAPILGVLGSAGALSRTKILVLTTTRAFLRYEFADGSSVHRSFPWSDVTEVHPASNDREDVFLRCKSLGWIPIPGCRRAREVANAFRTLAIMMGYMGQGIFDQPAEVDTLGGT
ncbi:hypothetical protein LVJ94_50385 [Pendulispora rubella]|uniref:PRTRC system protein F n=1 Tax=Pendulispora rubella TaxID=2741070 RepID=A0ABZ2L2C3_9BACT